MTASNTHNQLRSLAVSVDRSFHCLYASQSRIDINDHVYIDENVSSSSLAEVLAYEQDDTLHLSIRFSPSLAHYFSNQECPSIRLTSHNLGLLAIVAEEVSHFQCLCQAAESENPVSRFDLELQAEFDKFLIASTFLIQQMGEPHPVQLARLLFDSSAVYQDSQIYERANKIAASWWWSQINQYGNALFVRRPDLIASLKKLRYVYGEAKLATLAELKPKNFKRSA